MVSQGGFNLELERYRPKPFPNEFKGPGVMNY